MEIVTYCTESRITNVQILIVMNDLKQQHINSILNEDCDDTLSRRFLNSLSTEELQELKDELSREEI